MKKSTTPQPSPLPTSSGSREGASGGSLGGATAQDLERGYTLCETERAYDGLVSTTEPEPNTGFLSRPHGWER